MDVSIIIVNYNTSKLINDCIESIFRLVTDIDYEIIIVDNNTENLSDTIVFHDNSQIKILQLSENVGFGRANNAGSMLAAGRNLFFLNPDTILLNNAVKILSDYLDSNPICGACGGNLYDANLNPVHSFRVIFPSIMWELNELTRYKLEKIIYGESCQFNYSSQPKKVAYITGADIMIRKNLFNQLNGFSNDFFMYYEETDLCKRIAKKGYSIISIPTSKIQHLEGKSYSCENKNISFNPFRWTSMFESMFKYYSKYHSKAYCWLSFKIINLTLWIKACLGSQKNKLIYDCLKSILEKKKQ